MSDVRLADDVQLDRRVLEGDGQVAHVDADRNRDVQRRDHRAGVLVFQFELDAVAGEIDTTLCDPGAYLAEDLGTIPLTQFLDQRGREVANVGRLLPDDVLDQRVGESGHARAVHRQDLVVDPFGQFVDSWSGGSLQIRLAARGDDAALRQVLELNGMLRTVPAEGFGAGPGAAIPGRLEFVPGWRADPGATRGL